MPSINGMNFHTTADCTKRINVAITIPKVLHVILNCNKVYIWYFLNSMRTWPWELSKEIVHWSTLNKGGSQKGHLHIPHLYTQQQLQEEDLDHCFLLKHDADEQLGVTNVFVAHLLATSLNVSFFVQSCGKEGHESSNESKRTCIAVHMQAFNPV